MVDTDATTGRRSTWRRLAGFVAVTLAVALAVLFALGVWNPWHLVLLTRRFSNPFFGGIVVFALAFVAAWLLAPVHSEARDITRMRWRIAFGLAFLVSLLGFGVSRPFFVQTHDEVARSPSGQRAVAMLDKGTDAQRLHVWVGKGLGRRDVGDLGHPCGETQVWFQEEDLVHVSTSYGARDLRLDPATGRPRDTLGPTCSG